MIAPPFGEVAPLERNIFQSARCRFHRLWHLHRTRDWAGELPVRHGLSADRRMGDKRSLAAIRLRATGHR
jgi:hypothetical protein